MTAAAAVPIFVAHLAITARLRSPHRMDMSGWAGHAQASALLIASKHQRKTLLCGINNFWEVLKGWCRWVGGSFPLLLLIFVFVFLFFSSFFFVFLRFLSFFPILPGQERKRLQFTVKMGNVTPTPSHGPPLRRGRPRNRRGTGKLAELGFRGWHNAKNGSSSAKERPKGHAEGSTEFQWGVFPDLLFLALCGKATKTTQKSKDFFSPPKPLNSLGKKGKALEKQGNSLQGKKQGNPKKQGKEDQGSSHHIGSQKPVFATFLGLLGPFQNHDYPKDLSGARIRSIFLPP